MNLRGVVVGVDGPNTVSTSYGESDLCEMTIRPEKGAAEPVSITCWGKWSETAEYADVGMELAVHDAEEEEYQGETQYSVGSDGWVVLEPDFLVDVTSVRSWIQCPRMYYLNKIGGVDHAYPVVKGTIVHEVFGDLLRGRDLEESIADRIDEAGLDLGLLDREAAETTAEVREHASAIEGWLQQGQLTDGGTIEDDGSAVEAGESKDGQATFEPSASEWRSEMTLISERFGIKGRADAVRRGMPVELKTGKNTRREPRFQDKVQATCYALILGDRTGKYPDTGTLLYTKNAAVERTDESGDLSPAKEFSIGEGLLNFVLRSRNALAAMEHDASVPTGYEAEAKCEYCFEQDTCMAVSGRLNQESKAGQVGTAIPEEERDYFDRFYTAIEHERRTVHREYAKLWEQTPEERADDDRALVDLEPVGKRELDGGRWELRAEGTGAVSKIREGDLVLASDGDPVAGTAELARVERLGGVDDAGGGAADDESDDAGDGADVIVTADEPVDLRRLDVYPSELMTDRLLTALHDGVLTQPPEAKDVLFERRAPEFAPVDADEPFVDNNAAQNEAVELAVGAEDCALIHGPPGTGKTYTLAKIVRALVERGDRVLLSAFTNRAVDNAIEALEEQGFTDIVRMGTESGVRPDMQKYRLDQSGEPGECAGALREASVVAATTATAGSRRVKTQSFDVAVVDEAGQLTEPATLAATALADRFVLVGDHHQLPPVVQSEAANADADGGRSGVADLSTSMFQRLAEAYPEASVMLDRQYRMSQAIQAFSSREFYDGQLRPATGAVAGQRLSDLDGVDADRLPTHLQDSVNFVDPDGTAEGNTNPIEADAVVEIVQSYLDAGVAPTDIGVIAPYRAQVAELNARIRDEVTVDTVDRFQGSSKEVIVISFVATESLDSPIFEDFRRVNVALTRAKKSLVLVGDGGALATDDLYGRMVEWAK